MQKQQVNFAQLQEKINVLIAEAHCVIKDAHNICRQKASESLIFILSDSDRMKLITDDTYTHPIAYAMKGYSLNVKTMRQMVQEIHNSLHQKNIPVLCECFDGQWANLAFKTEEGEPLTLLHLQNKSWEMASHLSRCNVLLKLKDMSSNKIADLVAVTQEITYGKLFSKSGNVTVTVCNMEKGQISYILQSNGGHLDETMLLCHVSLNKIKNITKDHIHKSRHPEQENQKILGLAHDDIDLISTLQPDLVNEICEDLEANNTGCDIGLEDFLSSPKLQILKEILSKLQISGKSEKCDRLL